MAKVNIAGIDIDAAAQKDNTPEERAQIFAHLSGAAKQQAVKELEESLQDKPQPKPPAEKKAPESKES